MAPSCPAQCSHYARHSLACSPCQQLPWQPQPKACKRSLTENEGKENIGRKKEWKMYLNGFQMSTKALGIL